MRYEIKNLNNQTLTSLLLRLGLAMVFLYAAAGSLLHPQEWIGYLPPFLLKMEALNSAVLLKIFAVYEILLAVWLISNRYIRYVGLLCAATLLGIILAQPSALIVTFRDIGLIFMALAIAALEK
jgi:hypothetical protein